MITDTASEDFAERLGEIQTSTELTGTLCVEKSQRDNGLALEFRSDIVDVRDGAWRGDWPDHVDVTLESFDQTRDLRFVVEESAGAFEIVAVQEPL